MAWLKTLRLHKYAGQLVGDPLQRLHSLTMEDLATLGLTAGASKKLLSKSGPSDGPLPWEGDLETMV